MTLALSQKRCAPESILRTPGKRMDIGTFGWTPAQLSKLIPTLTGWVIRSPTSKSSPIHTKTVNLLPATKPSHLQWFLTSSNWWARGSPAWGPLTHALTLSLFSAFQHCALLGFTILVFPTLIAFSPFLFLVPMEVLVWCETANKLIETSYWNDCKKLLAKFGNKTFAKVWRFQSIPISVPQTIKHLLMDQITYYYCVQDSNVSWKLM